MKKNDKDIQIDEDLEHQRKSWLFQRTGMAFLSILLILSFLGFAGNGPFSGGTETSVNGKFKVEYQRIARISSPIDMSIIIKEDLVDNDTLKLMISKSFIHSVEIQSIVPGPAEEQDLDQNVQYTFVQDRGAHINMIRIIYKFRRYGFIEHFISAGGDEANVNQFIWP